MPQGAEAAKQVICEIIQAYGGKLAGKVRLHKAFYLAHIYYWKDNCGTLTDYPIVRLPNGPGIDSGDVLLAELESEGRIKTHVRFNGPYKELVFELTQPVDLDSSNPRCRAILEAVQFIHGKTAANLSEITHEYSRSWREGTNGEVLDIYADLLDDSEYARVQSALAEAEGLMKEAFGAAD